MGMRTVLALLVVAASASPASANRIRRPLEDLALYKQPIAASCDVQPGTWPRNGATDVPRNAHAWVFAGTQGNYELVHGDKREPVRGTVHEPFHMIELALPHLEANTRYTIVYADRELASFTTGTDNDVTPPNAPPAADARVTSALGTPVELRFHSTTSAVLYELTIRTRHGATTMLVPASSIPRFGAGCAGVQLEPRQSVCFDIADIDLAGTRSAVMRSCGTVEEDPRFAAARDEVRRRRESPGPNVPLLVSLLGIAVLAGIGIVKLRAQAARDAHERRSLAPIETALVRLLARAQRIRAIVTLVVCVTAIPLTGLTDANLAFVLATPLVACVIVAASTAQRLQRVLMDLDAHNASATYDGRTYLFTQPHHWIAIYPNQLDRVIAASLPTAKIR